MKNKLYITVALFLILFGVYSLQYRFYHRPVMTVIARFKDTPPIGQVLMKEGIGVFYRGYEIGVVTKVTLSEDTEYIVFYIEIYHPNLNFPKNTKALLRTQGVLGDKFISLAMPDNPSSEKMTDGTILEGTTVVEDLGEFIVNELGRGNVKSLLLSITDLAKNLDGVVKDNKGELNHILKESSKSGEDVNHILTKVRGIVENPQINSDIKSTLKYSSKSAIGASDIINSKEFKDTIKSAPKKFNKTLDDFESVKENISNVNLNVSKATENIPESTKTLNKTLNTYDCLGKGVSEILTKRFLLFKLMFGAPGSSLEKCK